MGADRSLVAALLHQSPSHRQTGRPYAPSCRPRQGHITPLDPLRPPKGPTDTPQLRPLPHPDRRREREGGGGEKEKRRREGGRARKRERMKEKEKEIRMVSEKVKTD